MAHLCTFHMCVGVRRAVRQKHLHLFNYCRVSFIWNTHKRFFFFQMYNFKRVFHTNVLFFVCFGSQSSLLRLSCVWSYVPYYTFWCGFLCLYEGETKIIFYYVIMQHIFKARQVVKRKIIVKNTPFFDVHHFSLFFRKNYVFVWWKGMRIRNFLNDDYLSRSNFLKKWENKSIKATTTRFMGFIFESALLCVLCYVKVRKN